MDEGCIIVESGLKGRDVTTRSASCVRRLSSTLIGRAGVGSCMARRAMQRSFIGLRLLARSEAWLCHTVDWYAPF